EREARGERGEEGVEGEARGARRQVAGPRRGGKEQRVSGSKAGNRNMVTRGRGRWISKQREKEASRAIGRRRGTHGKKHVRGGLVSDGISGFEANGRRE